MKSLKITLLLVLLSFTAQAQEAGLDWTFAMGGTNDDYGRSIAVDASGNTYTTGQFRDTIDFDPGPGIFNLTAAAGSLDVFICKLDASGAFVWAKNLGGIVDGGGVSITLDANGNVYCMGNFDGVIDFDPGPGIYNLSSVSVDIFICKLDANGNFLWAIKMGGSNYDYGTSIAIDASGNVYSTGLFEGTADFDPGLGVYNLVPTTSFYGDIFISKLDSNGTFLWAKDIGGTSDDQGNSIAVDANGNVYTTGSFQGTVDFDFGPGVFNIIANHYNGGIFLLKLDTNGNFIWAKGGSGSSGYSYGNAVTVDASGNIYTTGRFVGTVDFDPGLGTFNLIAAGGSGVFVSKSDSSGAFLWAKSMEGIYTEESHSIAVDARGNVYTTGSFQGTVDFDPGPNLFNLTSAGFWDFDIFISKLDSSGSFLWAKNMGGTSFDNGHSIAVDANENVYTIGSFSAIADFDPGSGFLNLTSHGGNDFFISKLTPQNIIGRIFQDFNQNCIKDTIDVGLAYRNLIINPGNLIVTTNSSGIWYIDSLAAGNYSITADTTSGNWRTTCPVTQNFTVVHPDSFTIAPSFGFISNSPCSEPDISIHAPFLRPGFSNQKVYITACNDYTATGLLDSAYVIVELDTLLTVQSGSLPYTSLGNNQYSIFIGDLYPGQCIDFWLSCTVSPNAILSQTLCMSAELYPADACIFDSIPNPFPAGISPCNTAYDNSNIALKAECRNDTIVFIVYNTGSGNMSCFSQIRLFIDGQLVLMDSIQLTAGDTAMFVFAGDGRTWRMEVDQHPLHPGNSQPSITIELCGNENNWTSDLVNILPHDDADPVIDIYCGLVRGSYDPNDKIGYPYGLDSTHYIRQNQDIEYLIRFQNTGTDTAFTVTIRDTLPLELDIFSVLSGAGSHDYNFRTYGPRVLEWTFNNIMLPDSNTNEPASNGFVTFKVKQNRNLPIGTVINNSAAIYFDFNAPVITNTYFHTIDSLRLLSWDGQQTITQSFCGSIQFGNLVYNQSGTYFQGVENNGFDSLYTIVLNSLATDSTIFGSQCDSFMYNGQTYLTSGIYTQVLPNTAGCDSTIFLNLNITHSTIEILNETACDSFSLNGQTYSNSGTYTQVLTNTVGCDSTITVNLIVGQSSFSTLSDSACDTYNLNGQSYSNSGTYTQILPNTAGCDSTITLNLNITNSSSETLNETVCDSLSLNGQTYTNSGIYTQILTNTDGCDSIITINLTIEDSDLIDTTLSRFGGTLSSNQPNATYQWLDCNNGNAPITGATEESFSPTANGSYAVQITNGACTATSGCYNVTNVAVEQVQLGSNIRLYPNPTKNQVIIDFGQWVEGAAIKIYSIEGKLLQSSSVQAGNQTGISLETYPSGLYLIVVQVEGESPKAFKVSRL